MIFALIISFFSAPVGDDELSFEAGVLIMLKTHVGSDWLRGRLLNGNEGIFPKKYVEIVVGIHIDTPSTVRFSNQLAFV